MGFLTKPDKIGAISHSSGVISLQPSILTVGGQQFTTGVLNYTITGLSASTKYNLFAVAVGATVSLVPSTNSITTGPTGYTKFLYLRSFMTNGSSAFGSFAGAIADPFPVGTVLDSLLTEAQFQALMGTTWILMDSRSVAGSMYAAITGASTMTDARGQFRRTKNNGRADGNQDPGGERAIGNLQGQATAKNGLTAASTDGGHSHAFKVSGANGPNYNPLAGAQITNWQYAAAGVLETGYANITTTIGSSDAETRPRNIVVNTFVKINME